MRMYSGAGHDLINMSFIAPSALLFIPSKGGISHRYDEYSSPEDIKAGAEVFLETIKKIDKGSLKLKIKIINPNTTQSMTDSIYDAALRSADPETEILAVSPKTGPDSIECYVDEYLSVPGVLQEIIKGAEKKKPMRSLSHVLVILGCPAREITDKPVLEYVNPRLPPPSLLRLISALSRCLSGQEKVTEDIVKAYGAESFCRSIRSTGLSVLDFGKHPEKDWQLWQIRAG